MEPTNGEQEQFTPISDVGEFGLIDRLQAVLGEPDDEDLVSGITDDAAVYRVGDGRVHVMTTDALIEGVHFDRRFMPMQHLGVKALGVNVSDVAAMNAAPRYAAITLGLPGKVHVEPLEELYRGFKQACDAYGVTIIGGDTTAARRLTLSVTVIGEADEEAVVYRRGARVGDALCVTGDLGAAYAGLQVLLGQQRAAQDQGEAYVPELDDYRYVIQRQLAPTARLSTVRDWADRGVRPNALIDISDGLASEVHHLCKQSRVGAVVRAAALPVDPETRRVADALGEDVDTFALFGGEDYELLFTLPEDALDQLDQESFNVIGEVTPASEGIRVQTPGGEPFPLSASGFQHFGG